MTAALEPCPNRQCRRTSDLGTKWRYRRVAVECRCGVRGPEIARTMASLQRAYFLSGSEAEKLAVEAWNTWLPRDPQPPSPAERSDRP